MGFLDPLDLPTRGEFSRDLTAALLEADPRPALWRLVGTAACALWLPELPALAQTQDPSYFHKDNLEHSIEVAAKVPASMRVRLSALLHDCGKPATRAYGPDGVTFHGHEFAGAVAAERRLTALGFPEPLVDDVARLVELHVRIDSYAPEWSDRAVARLAAEAGHTLPDLLLLARADTTAIEHGTEEAIHERMDELERRLAELDHRSPPPTPVLDGHEIMRCLDLAPGPSVGVARDWLLAHDAELEGVGRDEACRRLRAWWAIETAGT